ncbi:MAG: deoxyribose-phosphate aldolase [Planctomycetes bacterium]|nr:deoxyribose-phosphate aldolase [Planctomycetota bacterium]
MPLFTPGDREAIRNICAILDYSAALVTTASKADVIKACDEALRYKFAAVPVFPSYLPLVAERLRGSGIAPQLACGFPCGGVATAVKRAEVVQALADGATEVDMVINIGRLIDKDFRYVEQDIQAVVETAHAAGVTVKVILEIGLLSDEQKKHGIDIACAANADFIKTCTGFAEGRATIRDIALIKDHARGRIKIKASGGVASLEDAAAFIQAGADRVAGRFNFVAQMRELGIEEF